MTALPHGPREEPVSAPPEGEAPHPNAGAHHAQEVEIWWGGYAGRTMLPLFTLCVLLTVAILLAARLVWREESVSTALISHFAMYMVVVLWAAALVWWAYRSVSISYRLTTRRLLCEKGFKHPAPLALELASIAAVRVEQNLWERWVGVGRLRIEMNDGHAEVLHGVFHPDPVAAEILRHVSTARPRVFEVRG